MIRHCFSCGRPMENKNKLENPETKYCSQKCQKEKLNLKDRIMEQHIQDYLEAYKDSNICPSQFSRSFFGPVWRDQHQRVIKACRRMHLKKKLLITQKKKPIKNLNFKGPIRIQCL